jgi:hypothetical protein
MESVIPCLSAGRYPLNYGTLLLRKNITKRPVLQVILKIYLWVAAPDTMVLRYLSKIFYFCSSNILREVGKWQLAKSRIHKMTT